MKAYLDGYFSFVFHKGRNPSTSEQDQSGWYAELVLLTVRSVFNSISLAVAVDKSKTVFLLEPHANVTNVTFASTFYFYAGENIIRSKK